MKGSPSLLWVGGFLTLLIGGSVLVVAEFGFSNLPWAGAIVLTALLLMALEGARKMGMERDAANDQLADTGKRREVKVLLARMSQQGSVLLTLGEHLQASALHEWDAQICDLVRRSMGDGERARLDWGGVPTGVRFKPVTGLSSDDAGLIMTRLLQIGDLIPRVDTILLEPDFDPQSWSGSQP